MFIRYYGFSLIRFGHLMGLIIYTNNKSKLKQMNGNVTTIKMKKIKIAKLPAVF